MKFSHLQQASLPFCDFVLTNLVPISMYYMHFIHTTMWSLYLCTRYIRPQGLTTQPGHDISKSLQKKAFLGHFFGDISPFAPAAPSIHPGGVVKQLKKLCCESSCLLLFSTPGCEARHFMLQNNMEKCFNTCHFNTQVCIVRLWCHKYYIITVVCWGWVSEVKTQKHNYVLK